MKTFDSQQELLDFYKSFELKTLSELSKYIKQNYPEIEIKENKGKAGQILEALIGSPPNSDPRADVKNLGIELKVLPLRKISNKIQPKERSKIKSINYSKIIKENWSTSEVRSKMEKILFLMYEHPSGKSFIDSDEFIFRGPMLFELKNEDESIVQNDWEQIKEKVVSENADKISEGDSQILGACTSGTGKLIVYGNSKQAKQRSYSLKHNYLKVFYDRNKNHSVYEKLVLDKKQEPHEYVINKLNTELKGKNLNEISTIFDVDFSDAAKNSFRLLLNRVLKIDDDKKILDLELEGINLKTIPVNSENKPWESMSFPKFSLVDILDEEWEGEENYNNESVFKNIITNGYIFIPIIKEKISIIKDEKKVSVFNDWKNWTIGESVYWKANDKEMSIIKAEWERAKEIIEKGVEVFEVKQKSRVIQGNNLLKSSDTEIIHIRPHANNSSDIDKPYLKYTKGKVKICWQSFWLNKVFTEKILNRAK